MRRCRCSPRFSPLILLLLLAGSTHIDDLLVMQIDVIAQLISDQDLAAAFDRALDVVRFLLLLGG
jgi:hypothetical protein